MAISIKQNKIPTNTEQWKQMVELAGPYPSEDLQALRDSTPEGVDAELLCSIDQVLMTATTGESNHARIAG